MKKTLIEITTSDGKVWPCRVTLGAMRRYKAMTGEDVVKMREAADMAAFLYCCVRSACAADRKEFDYSVDDFCDMVDADALKRIEELFEGEKKTSAKV